MLAVQSLLWLGELVGMKRILIGVGASILFYGFGKACEIIDYSNSSWGPSDRSLDIRRTGWIIAFLGSVVAIIGVFQPYVVEQLVTQADNYWSYVSGLWKS